MLNTNQSFCLCRKSITAIQFKISFWLIHIEATRRKQVGANDFQNLICRFFFIIILTFFSILSRWLFIKFQFTRFQTHPFDPTAVLIKMKSHARTFVNHYWHIRSITMISQRTVEMFVSSVLYLPLYTFFLSFSYRIIICQ